MQSIYQLFDKIFIKYIGIRRMSDVSKYFDYHDMDFNYIKKNYKDIPLDDLINILYKYDITIEKYKLGVLAGARYRKTIYDAIQVMEAYNNNSNDNYSEKNNNILESTHNDKLKNINKIKRLYEIKSGKRNDITGDDLDDFSIGVDI